MPPQWACGSFIKQSGTGLQSWGPGPGEGLSFLPKALILWASGADEYAEIQIGESQRYGNRFAIGITAAPGDSWCAATMQAELDTFGLTNDYSWNFSRALTLLNFNIFGGQIEAKCDVDSYDIITPGVKYGFTLDWVTNTGGFSRKINFVAFGGDIVSNVVHIASLGQSGSQSITGVGFCPDLLVFVGGPGTPDEGTAVGGLLSFGVANHDLDQWGVSIGGDFSVSPSYAARCQSTTHAAVQVSNNTSTLRYAAAVNVFGPDGFTLAQSGDEDAGGFTTGGAQFGVLCLKGIASVIGSFNKATAVGVQTVSTPDLTPLGVLLASFQRTATSNTVEHARIGLGAADLFSNQVAAAGQETSGEDAVETHADCVAYNTAAFVKYDNNTQTVEALAGLSTVGDGSFALGWDPCDAVATEMLFIAVGSGSTGTCEEEDEDEEPPTFHCVDDLTDADLISFRYDAGDQGIVNQVIARFDHDAETDDFTKMLIFEHDSSIRKYGRRPPIVIESKGLRTALGADDYLRARAREIFRRFGDAPPDVLQIESFYRKNAWEAGDIICVSSPFVPNLEISGRGIAEKPYEIVDLRPQFGARGRILATLLSCLALSHDLPELPVSGTDPGAPGPEEAVTTLGLMGVGRGVWEIA